MKRIILLLTVLMCMMAVMGASAKDVAYVDENNNVVYENGFFMRHYEGYSEDAQVFLSVLDACNLIISDFSPIIDPYISGEVEFDDQWDVIYREVVYMSSKACSYVMTEEVPDELAEHADEIYFGAYHMMLGNDLLLTAIQSDSSEMASMASYYLDMAHSELSWWDSMAQD